MIEPLTTYTRPSKIDLDHVWQCLHSHDLDSIGDPSTGPKIVRFSILAITSIIFNCKQTPCVTLSTNLKMWDDGE